MGLDIHPNLLPALEASESCYNSQIGMPVLYDLEEKSSLLAKIKAATQSILDRFFTKTSQETLPYSIKKFSFSTYKEGIENNYTVSILVHSRSSSAISKEIQKLFGKEFQTLEHEVLQYNELKEKAKRIESYLKTKITNFSELQKLYSDKASLAQLYAKIRPKNTSASYLKIFDKTLEAPIALWLQTKKHLSEKKEFQQQNVEKLQKIETLRAKILQFAEGQKNTNLPRSLEDLGTTK